MQRLPERVATVSDTDRLADYLARQADPDHQRTLPDGCVCGLSLVACNCKRYVDAEPCCFQCRHHD